MKDRALDRGRRQVGQLLYRQESRLVGRRPVGLALLHEIGHRREAVVVDGRLDVEDADCVFNQLALADAGVVQRGVGRVHVRPRSQQGLDVVVRAYAAVAAKAGGHRLVAAIHRDQRQVDVDNQV